MLRQIVVSIAVSACNIAIHAIVMTATVSVLMAAHIAEVAAWAIAYAVVGIAPAGTDLVYFAFVNYTTLGYGDVVPLPRWSLLGPMTAMNGVLLFGWSTAVIFAVLQKAWVREVS